jgi:hypothetical protein
VSLDNILTSPALAGMRALRQWIVYETYPDVSKPGKRVKMPVHYQTARPCSVVEPANWTDAASAVAAVRVWGASYGVGFCFTKNDPYWFLDIDGALQPDRTWSALSQQLVSALPGAALEISVSGTGLHLFGRGAVPPHRMKNIDLHIELYTEGRFCALTGTSLQGNCDADLTSGIGWVATTYFPPRETVANSGGPDDGPCPEWNGPQDDTELLRRAMMSKSTASVFGGKASFSDLWVADADVLGRAYPPDSSSSEPFDRSSADAALASHLAFWSGKDHSRIDRLMRLSGLARDKYDRPDYLPRTISNACAAQRDVLRDKPMQPPPGPAAPPPGPAAPPPGPAPAAAPTVASPAAPGATGGPGMTPVTGATFLRAEQQRELFAGCVYVLDAHRVLVPGGHMLKPDQFRAHFGGYTFMLDEAGTKTTRSAFEAFVESQVLRPPRADGTCFRPGLPYGAIVTDAGRTRANTYWPIRVARRPGDATPFWRHLELLVPNEQDRRWLFYYMCACVQFQGYKFQWAPVIQGAEGNGKTFLSRCVAYAIGYRYVHWPKATKLGKDFNAWMLNKTFYAVEDIYVPDAREDIFEQLKPMITGGDGLEIEAKGVDQVSAEICGNFIFNTNHKNSLRKTLNDRRFAHFYTAQQTAQDIARDKMDGSYMVDLYDWFNDQLGREYVAEILWTTPIPDEYNPARGLQRAPKTSSTDEAIEAGHGAVEQEVLEAIDREEVGFRGGWISSGALDSLLKKIGRDRAVPLSRRRDVLQSLGYDWHPALPKGRVHNPVAPDAAKVKLFVRQDRADLLALERPPEVAAAYTAAQGVSAPAAAAR